MYKMHEECYDAPEDMTEIPMEGLAPEATVETLVTAHEIGRAYALVGSLPCADALAAAIKREYVVYSPANRTNVYLTRFDAEEFTRGFNSIHY